ncbi:ABC transporter ATP-binding protein [Thalassococcus sp. BH17M4-6]|uniref:ABC transporter ATP-binding protein n=1 Tax=Thalassococcus sp. BH17M4-6 TaxID=3413148 RepID=UPI003BE35D19
MAAFEAIGIASILPFLTVMSNPLIIETSPYLSRVYSLVGSPGADDFLFLLGLVSFALLITTAVVRMITYYAINRYTQMRARSISERLLEGYFRQGYSFFLNRHSGEFTARILGESNQAVVAVIRPFLTLVASAVTMTAITSLLIIVDPVTALVAGGILGGTYGAIFAVTRGFLSRIGRERVAANRERFASVSDALNGIKVIKVLGREQTYLKRFREAAIKVARNQAASMTLGQLPKFAIEAIAFGGIILLCLVLMARHGGAGSDALAKILPILGLYAFAGYRLLPTFQSAYQSIAAMRFGSAAVESVYEDLVLRESLPPLSHRRPSPLGLHEGIELRNISFRYPGSDSGGLRNLTLEIPAGHRVGVVGSTGAGKTTLMDVLLGLLEPTEGEMRVDGEAITQENVRAWQQTIGYVPQDIFLVDASTAENIALGVPSENIDRERVIECARMAQIHDFITGELPQEYDTKIGERGVRLSGGQRQRLGIARALYHDPDLIVFDEATSALDNLTEKDVMAAVNSLSRTKTIIMVAHRISTVQACDIIVVLDKGKVMDSGTHDKLLADSPTYQAIAGQN